MSIFSSLSYLLKRASFGLEQTSSSNPHLNFFPVETNILKNLSRFADNKSSSITSPSYDEYLYLITGAGQFSNTEEPNSAFDTSATNLTILSSSTTYASDIYTSESDEPFPNESSHHNADLLLESWWNILDERYMRHGWGWTITLIIAYMLILFIGVIGNLMVILVVSLRPQMRTVTNMFIMNLAVADLFVVIFCVPSTLLANIFAPWILGSFLCKAVAYVQGVAVCASAYSLAAISLDRCQAIHRNLERPRGFSRSICIIIVICIWVSALSLTIPWAIMFDVKISEYDGLCYCVETWEVEKHGNIYFLVVNLAGFYVIPLLLIFVSNWIIYFQVTHRKVPQDSYESSAAIRKMHRQTRNDVLKMLGIVTLTFLFSWLPLYILLIVIKFTKNMTELVHTVLGILMPIAQWLGSWNSSMNPILYAFLNKKFRRMLKSILPFWIPVNLIGKDNTGTGYTTSANIGKNTAGRRINKRSEFNYQHKNGYADSRECTALLISRYQEHTGTVTTTTIQSLSNRSSTTPVIGNRIAENIFDTVMAKMNTNEMIPDL